MKITIACRETYRIRLSHSKSSILWSLEHRRSLHERKPKNRKTWSRRAFWSAEWFVNVISRIETNMKRNLEMGSL